MSKSNPPAKPNPKLKPKPAAAVVLLPEALALPCRNLGLFLYVIFLAVLPCYVASLVASKWNPFLFQHDLTPFLPFVPSAGIPASRRLILTLDPFGLLLSQLPVVALSRAAAVVIRSGNTLVPLPPSTSPRQLFTGLAGKWRGVISAVVLAQLATSLLGALFATGVIYVGLIHAGGSLPARLVSLVSHAAVAGLGVALLGLGLICECGLVAAVAEEDRHLGGVAALATGWDMVVGGRTTGTTRWRAADAGVVAMLFFLLDEACASLSGALGVGLAGVVAAVAVQVIVQLLECCVITAVYYDWKRRRIGGKDDWDEEDLECNHYTCVKYNSIHDV